MRLGFHYHIPAEIRSGRIYTLSLQGLFLDSLAPFCESIILFLFKPTKGESGGLDYAIQSSNIELVSLIKHYSIPIRLILSPLVRYKINRRLTDLDIMLIRAPTPLLPLISKDIKNVIPFAYLVVGEMTDHIDHIKQPAWRKGLLKRYILWNETRQRHYAKAAFVFANSFIVYNKYKRITEHAALIFTTTLKRSDFFIKDDTCLGKPIQILFTGRIDSAKGILEIVEAVGILNNKEKIDCCLNIVGWADHKNLTPDTIRKMSRKYGIEEKIVFHGKKSVGHELFSFYRNADIFIVASQVAEGFPRTIWEALAHSVPVISTPVGSIPHFLRDQHNVLLVEQRNSDDIVAKVKMLINTPFLRQQLIQNGREIVSDVTLEIQGRKMCNQLVSYLNSKRAE